ncbi:MAG: TIGR00270 family protein [Candidatus Aenigmarchaeota archaeon CG_4_10_14_0_8_um_filter_37_24]|nr:TIGR00270 family protein [Candidatus Aenigmarchaeota archaeon]OIN85340.1 MAG: TIGR00270 family protein [Candidatus Aenigmarchaeota archaeon CG1_02_38_14]PIW40887.1 MAG: TIGR00270 family protein [Candidatus Aenigmarchaeota archaeon CG15_BIG_FIL_POST_REV_8_21_14_020_37_27]PIY36483.1 MAG: TIGR00270 family protein [Candidatus Aenigmarchaeota archaeon CG_4_10_14_3_um_filter_37_21]PIZ34405.1 MAG: TIGR00270 family protein [Candidatus Aenigmarchaeota archaeon CG_4_10_14_0_8_um_filter_37_24]PJB75224
MTECTLCGRNTDKLFLAEVEGAHIEVCEVCGNFGKIIEEIKHKPKTTFVKREAKSELEEPEEDFKPNYGKLIIQARQKIGLERKDFALKIKEKESLIKRVESQQMIPDAKLTKKIEDFLEIKLNQIYESRRLDPAVEKGSLTLGDIVVVEDD